MSELNMDKMVNFCKQYGFIFQGSEIYGGLANTWDYGPLGAELKSNVKKAWLKKFVQEDPNNVGLDSAILMNPTSRTEILSQSTLVPYTKGIMEIQRGPIL